MDNRLINDLKANLVIEHNHDDALLTGYLFAALSYACGYQHKPAGYYDTHPLEGASRQAVLMLATHFYESRDGATAGFLTNSPSAAAQVWRAVNQLLVLERDWKI